MRLVIHSQGAEPYDLGVYDLAEAIDSEANVIADDAGSELLAENTGAERDALAARVSREAAAALREPGDSYRDPTRVLWTLEADDHDGAGRFGRSGPDEIAPWEVPDK